MARARNIKPGFFKNYDLADLGPYAQLLFAGLWCLADKEGRLEDKPRFIKAEIFPYYDCDVNGELTQLARLGFIHRYQADGMDLIEIANFVEHQSPHHTEKASKLPSRSDHSRGKPHEIRASDNNGELTVNPPKHNGGNPPDSLIHRFTDSGFSDSPIPDSNPLPASGTVPPKKPASPKPESETASTWTAYSDAYFNRYGTEPVRNASVNGRLAQFVARLGRDEAPLVARFFVGHNNGYYVREMHAVGAMLKDAEKLRTEWATNTKMTQTKALQADKTQTNFDAFAPLIAEAEARERSNG